MKTLKTTFTSEEEFFAKIEKAYKQGEAWSEVTKWANSCKLKWKGARSLDLSDILFLTKQNLGLEDPFDFDF